MLHNIFCDVFSLFIEVTGYFTGILYITYIKKELKKYLVSQGKSLSLGEFLKRSTVLTLNEPNIMMEKTLVILKPCTLQRGLVGEITNRFERKGLRLAGMKMVQLTDEVLSEHYAHLSSKPFFQRVKDAMMVCPVIVCCFEGVDAVQVVRTLTGPTNGRLAAPGTIRGDYSMSFQENIVHASDSPETAEVELKRFFKPDEIFEYKQAVFGSLYANDEY